MSAHSDGPLPASSPSSAASRSSLPSSASSSSRPSLPAFPPSPVVSCGAFSIDIGLRRLSAQGEAIALGARAFDLLVALVQGRGRWLSADTLRKRVWPDKDVGDNNLRVQMTHLRRVLGAQAIAYHGGQGYQLMLPTSLEAPHAPAAPLPDSPHGSLPESIWPMVGRDALLEELLALWPRYERLTLLGPGGAGKTALALSAARTAALRLGVAAWWVELAPLRDGAQVAQAVCDAMKVPVSAKDALSRLAAECAGSRDLIVLDNCEHLVHAVVELCDRLLTAAPGLRVLCTSRTALRSAGEHVLPVPPLRLPDRVEDPQHEDASQALERVRDSGACALFEARARASDPRFRLTVGNAPVVADICRRLDGNALALVVAAARVGTVGLLPLKEQLDERLAWAPQRWASDAGAQHLSLEAALDWSHALLQPGEQRLLRALGVFSGQFSAQAARAVATAQQDTASDAATDFATATAPQPLAAQLEALVRHGLLDLGSEAVLGRDTGGVAYAMHESVRLYARQHLLASGHEPALRRALGHHLLAAMRAEIDGGPSTVLLRPEFVTALLPDIQATVTWATEADPLLALQLCATCAMPWRRKGLHALALRLSAPLLARPPAPDQVSARVDLLLGLCGVDMELEASDRIVARAEEVLALLGPAGDPSQRGLAQSWLGDMHAHAGRLEEAQALYESALQNYRAAGAVSRQGDVLNNLGWTLQARGLPEQARPLLMEALALYEPSQPDEWWLMVTYENLGELELGVDRFSQAADFLERACVLARRVPDHYRLANSLAMLAIAQLALGQPASAASSTCEALRTSLRQGFPRLQADACTALAGVLLARGRAGPALVALQAARTLRARHQLRALPQHQRHDDALAPRLASALDAAQHRAALAQGDLIPLAELLAWAEREATGLEG